MISKHYLLTQILECGYLDVYFLEGLMDNFDIDLDIEEIQMDFGKININLLILKAFEEIKDRFITENEKNIKRIIKRKDISNFEDYEIFTNCIDSHLWFTNDKIEQLFQTWKGRILCR